jgi:uncharacterized OsmC-like protein
MTTRTLTTINGIDTVALRRLAEEVGADAARGVARFAVTTAWKGGTRSDSHVAAWHLGGRILPRDFTLRADEPPELLGGNTAPNPQEMLMAAFNACMLVGFVALCALEGIEIRTLRLDTEGELDLRGFLGLDPSVKPGYESLRTTFRVSASATKEQLGVVLEAMKKTSPNRWNLGQPVALETELVVE